VGLIATKYGEIPEEFLVRTDTPMDDPDRFWTKVEFRLRDEPAVALLRQKVYARTTVIDGKAWPVCLACSAGPGQEHVPNCVLKAILDNADARAAEVIAAYEAPYSFAKVNPFASMRLETITVERTPGLIEVVPTEGLNLEFDTVYDNEHVFTTRRIIRENGRVIHEERDCKIKRGMTANGISSGVTAALGT
jgi:hypothetical protein